MNTNSGPPMKLVELFRYRTPATANSALVLGTVNSPSPPPTSASAATSRPVAGAIPRPASSTNPMHAMPSPATDSAREPTRSDHLPASGAITRAIAGTTASSMPDRVAP